MEFNKNFPFFCNLPRNKVPWAHGAPLFYRIISSVFVIQSVYIISLVNKNGGKLQFTLMKLEGSGKGQLMVIAFENSLLLPVNSNNFMKN
jgi:hypothetical protein